VFINPSLREALSHNRPKKIDEKEGKELWLSKSNNQKHLYQPLSQRKVICSPKDNGAAWELS
jgi:hypothetical protein